MAQAVSRATFTPNLTTVAIAGAVPAVTTAAIWAGMKVGHHQYSYYSLGASHIWRNGLAGALVAADAVALHQFGHRPTSPGDGLVEGAVLGGVTGATVPILRALVQNGAIQPGVVGARKFVGSTILWATGAAIAGAVIGAGWGQFAPAQGDVR